MTPSLLTWWTPKQQQSAIQKTRKQREYLQRDRFKRGLIRNVGGVVTVKQIVRMT